MFDAFGAKTYSNLAVVETKVDAVTVGGNGQVVIYNFTCFNSGAAVAYIQFHDALAANVTLGTTAPKFVVPLPVGGGVDGACIHGRRFTVGVCIAVTATAGGAGAPSAACIVQFDYQ